MSDPDSESPPAKREGFERRWINDENYTGPERRGGAERRRHPPMKGRIWPEKHPGEEENASPDEPTSEQETPATEEAPLKSPPPGKFKPLRP